MARSFHVDYNSLNQKELVIRENVQLWNTELEKINDSVKQLINSSNMSGNGSDNVKSYLDSVHNTIIFAINELLIEHMGHYYVYLDDYRSNVDSGLETVIDEDDLNNIKDGLKPQANWGVEINLNIQSILNSVSDLIYVTCDGYDNIENCHKDIDNHITNLNEDINELEDNHVNRDFDNTSDVLESLRSFIKERLKESRDYKSTFTVESLGKNESTINLLNSMIAMDGDLQENQDVFSDAMKSHEEYLIALNEELERREREAAAANGAKIGFTALVIVGAAVAGAFTSGFGAAVVVGAASEAIMKGGTTAINQYAKYGWDMYLWDYKEIGKDALIGGIKGGIKGAIGYGTTEVFKGIFNAEAKDALLSSSMWERVGTNAVLGTTKEITSGVLGRFTSTFATDVFSTGKVEESLGNASADAFDSKSILIDAGVGLFNGVYLGKKEPIIKKEGKKITKEVPSLTEKEKIGTKILTKGGKEVVKALLDKETDDNISIDITFDRNRFDTPTLFGMMA